MFNRQFEIVAMVMGLDSEMRIGEGTDEMVKELRMYGHEMGRFVDEMKGINEGEEEVMSEGEDAMELDGIDLLGRLPIIE